MFRELLEEQSRKILGKPGDRIRFRDLSNDARKIIVSEHLPDRVKAKISLDGFGIFSNFFPDDVKEKANVIIKKLIRRDRIKGDHSRGQAVYKYYDYDGEFIGEFDSCDYGSNVGFLFSTLPLTSQQKVLNQDLLSFDYIYGHGVDFYLALMNELGVYEMFLDGIAIEINDALDDQDREYGRPISISGNCARRMIRECGLNRIFISELTDPGL